MVAGRETLRGIVCLSDRLPRLVREAQPAGGGGPPCFESPPFQRGERGWQDHVVDRPRRTGQFHQVVGRNFRPLEKVSGEQGRLRVDERTCGPGPGRLEPADREGGESHPPARTPAGSNHRAEPLADAREFSVPENSHE